MPGALAVVQVQNKEAGDKNRQTAAEGIRQQPAAQPRHTAVQQGGNDKGELFARAGSPGPRKEQRKHRGQQCPVTEQRGAD